MYEDYTRQSLPNKRYRELLGSAICVFNSNNQFIIENILHINDEEYDWYKLIDKTSGQLIQSIKDTISQKSNNEIERLFSELVSMRNRIIHSFQITKNDEQILHTKNKNNQQFTITEDYLLKFIKQNELLSDKLHTLKLLK